jgi:hypothetical protein
MIRSRTYGRSLRTDGQQAVVDRDVNAVGVDAGQVEAQLDLPVAADCVHPHRGMPAVSGPQHAVELCERVERCKQHVPLTLL